MRVFQAAIFIQTKPFWIVESPITLSIVGSIVGEASWRMHDQKEGVQKGYLPANDIGA
jgi:hypothetical protein